MFYHSQRQHHVLPSLLLMALLSRGFASVAFFGPTDPTGQIDFSDGTACACPWSQVQYLCTVLDPTSGGRSTTVWRGSAFSCIAKAIRLSHANYSNPELSKGVCNNFSAQGLANFTDDCYTSVLTVNVAPGLNGRTVECTLTGDSRFVSGNDTLRVAMPLPPPSTPKVVMSVPDQSFTVSWAPPTAECGNAVTYTYLSSLNGSCGECTNNMTSESSTTCRGWTAQGQNCSITARADICAGLDSESQPVDISFPRPTAPSITGGEVVFDQSRGSASITVQWDPVDSTNSIAKSGGVTLLNGEIRDYLVTFISGDPVVVNCASATCTSSAAQPIPTNGTNLFIGVAARNAITKGEFGRAECSNFRVERSTPTGSMPLDIMLTCPMREGCVIRYGQDSTYRNLPSIGWSDEMLQNIQAGQTYYTEAQFNCGGFTFRVRDRFDTCECPSSGLFAGSGRPTDIATCPQGFSGGLRITSSNGMACYSGLTIDSTAEFVCDDVTQECSGSCGSMCMCGSGLTRAEWNVTFASTSCITPLEISTEAVAGASVVALVVVFLFMSVVAMVIYVFWKKLRHPGSDPGDKHSMRELSAPTPHDTHRQSPDVSGEPALLYPPSKPIPHQPAPPDDRDMYAAPVHHRSKTPQETSTAQPTPSDDHYAVPVDRKRGSSKKNDSSPPTPLSSEEQLTEYAALDLSKKSKATPLVYADIAVSGPSRPAPVPTAGQVTYSTIAGTEPVGPAEEGV